jgi:hypothetical protein
MSWLTLSRKETPTASGWRFRERGLIITVHGRGTYVA